VVVDAVVDVDVLVGGDGDVAVNGLTDTLPSVGIELLEAVPGGRAAACTVATFTSPSPSTSTTASTIKAESPSGSSPAS
jgi:hypothetical protein